MIFDIDTAILIGEALRGQERVVGVVNYSVIDSSDDVGTQCQLLLGHLRMMEDAGWVADAGTYNIAGDFQARLTYGGQLWLRSSSQSRLGLVSSSGPDRGEVPQVFDMNTR